MSRQFSSFSGRLVNLRGDDLVYDGQQLLTFFRSVRKNLDEGKVAEAASAVKTAIKKIEKELRSGDQ